MVILILGYLCTWWKHANACGRRMNDHVRIDLRIPQAPRGYHLGLNEYSWRW